MTKRRPRWRRWTRRILRSIGVLLILCALTIGGLLIVLHTDYGRELVRSRAERELSDIFVSEVRIRAIEGSLLSEFSIVGVEIEDAQGQTALSLGRVDISYSPTSLWNQTVDIDSVVLTDLSVKARRDTDGVLNLAQLVKPGDEEDDSDADDDDGPPSPWRILAPKIVLQSSVASLTEESNLTTLDEFAIDVAIVFHKGELTATIKNLGGSLARGARIAEEGTERPTLPLALTGVLRMSGAGLWVDDVNLDLGTAKLQVKTLELASDGATRGTANLTVPVDVVRFVDPTIDLLADLSLSIKAERENQSVPIALEVTGQLGASPLSLQGSISPEAETATLHLETKAIDASALWRDLVPSNVNLALDVETTGLEPATMSAKATLKVDGEVDDTEFGTLKLTAELEKGVASAKLRPTEGTKWIDASGTLQLEPLQILKSEFSLDHPKIQSLAGKYVVARGDVRLHATASGPLSAIKVEGELSSKRFAYLRNRTRGVRAKWNGLVGGGAYSGHLEAKVASVVAEQTPYGSVMLDIDSKQVNEFDVHLINRGPRRAHHLNLKSRVTIAPLSTRIDIETIVAGTRGLNWRGRGGRIVLGSEGDVSFHKIKLDSPAGHLLLDGEVEFGEGLSSGEVDLVAKDVDLSDISKALAIEPPLEGTVSLRARLRKQVGKKPRASIELALDEVRAGTAAPATSGTLAVRLDRRALSFDANLDAEGVGTVALTAEGKAPRNPMLPAGWQRLNASALTSASIRTSKLDVAALGPLAPNLPTSGTVSIEGQLGQAGEEGEFVIAVQDLVHPTTGEPANSELRLSIADQGVRLRGEAGIDKRVRATLSATALLPGPLLAPKTLANLDQRVLQEATLKIDQVDLFWWDQVLSLGYQPQDSSVELELQIGAGAQHATLDVAATQKAVDVFGKTQIRYSELLADVTASKITITMLGKLGNRRAASGTVHVGRGWDALLSGDPNALATAPVTADVAILGIPLALLQETFLKADTPATELAEGLLVASAKVTGTVSNPEVEVRANTVNGAVAGIIFSDLRASATYKDNHLGATVSGQQKAGGQLDIVSAINIGPRPTTKTTIKAHNWDLAFLKTLVPERSIGGLLSAKIDVNGALEKPTILGSAHLKKGSVHPGAPLFGLRNLDVELALTPERLTITGEGHSGRGELALNGHVAMTDLTPSSVDLIIELDDLPVEAGPLSVNVDTTTTVRGKTDGTDWRFDIDIGDTIVAVPGKLSRTLHPDQLPSDIVFVESIHTPPPAIAAVIANTPATKIDVYIRAPESIAVRGEPVRTIVDVDLHAQIAEELTLEGTVETRGGWIELFGRRYDLNRGDVAFGGSLDPGLDIKLTHDFSAMTLSVGVGGTGAEPELELRSDPALYDDSELLSFVLGASPDDDRSEETSTAAKATGVASNYVAGKLQGVVRDVVPIDVLKLELADDDATAEKLTVGEWLTDTIYLAYRRRFEAEDLENENEAVLEYRFRRRWLLELSYGDQGTGGADVLWIKRY